MFLILIVTLALAVISVGVHSGWPAGAYTSPWMVALWALLALAGCASLVRRRLTRRPVVLGIHVALLLILAGAAVTHFTGVSGVLHLRLGGGAVSSFTDCDGTARQLPETLTLTAFDVRTWPGTDAPRDYVSTVTDSRGHSFTVSMNSPAATAGYRLLQGTYDSDGLGVTMNVSRDPWGTGLTFAGYILLGLTMALYFLARRSVWRSALRQLRGAALLAVAVLPLGAAAADLGDVAVYHNGRICPMATLQRDFAVTVTGDRSCAGLTSRQLFEGYLFNFGEYKSLPLLKVKDRTLRGILGAADGRVSYEDFYAVTADGRLDLGDPAVQQRYAADIQRFEAVNMLVSGALLRVFPVGEQGGGARWYAPVDNLPAGLDSDRWMFIRKFWGLYNEYRLRGDSIAAARLLDALGRYQRGVLGDAMPDAGRLRLERTYNGLSPLTPVFVSALLLGLILFIILALRPAVGCRRRAVGTALNLLLWCWLTLLITLRWRVSGHVPMSNGYETMMLMAWVMSLIGTLSWRVAVLQPMTLLGAGLTLAVAAMSGGGAGVTGLMPVLASPLLSIHVACVMAAYALLLLVALTAVLALTGGDAARLQALSRVMLYPALALLAAGIFIGAVWADISWGRYWGWDPKEVWALITLLTYTPAAHPGQRPHVGRVALLPDLVRPRAYHLYLLAAFATVLVTYFGVNFILGGLHSYA